MIGGCTVILVVSQIIGLFAVGLYLLSYQLKKRKQIVWVTCISNTLYVVQYLLLGAFSGAVMDILSTVSSFFATQKNEQSFKRYARWIAAYNLIIIAVIGVAIAVVQKAPVELLPVTGAL